MLSKKAKYRRGIGTSDSRNGAMFVCVERNKQAHHRQIGKATGVDGCNSGEDKQRKGKSWIERSCWDRRERGGNEAERGQVIRRRGTQPFLMEIWSGIHMTSIV